MDSNAGDGCNASLVKNSIDVVFSAVFRITDDLKLAHVALPKDSEPARLNPDGTLVLRVKREETYRFDPTRQAFIERAK